MPTRCFQSSAYFSKKILLDKILILNTSSPLYVIESGSKNKYCTFTLFSEMYKRKPAIRHRIKYQWTHPIERKIVG